MYILNMQRDKVTQFAEKELYAYLSRMGCPDIEYILSIEDASVYGLGKVADSELDDCYCIEINEKKKSISANNPRALLIAVYRYLTLIGCRFLRPGKAFEIVPVHQSENDFFAEETHAATLRHRGVCIEGGDSIENVADFIDWLPKIGCNSFFFQFKTPHTFLKRWYDHVEGENGYWTEKSSERAMGYFDELMAERGLLRHRVGHGWTAEVIGAKNTGGWEKENSDVSEAVLPLIARVDGKRALIRQIANNTNLCLSNPESLKRFSDYVIEYLLGNPETEYLHIWLADGHHNSCECELCGGLRPSDHYITLLNFLDEKLSEKKINTKLCFLMYQDLLWAPLEKRLKNPERFALMFAPIHRTFDKSYGDVGYKNELPEFKLNRSPFPGDIESNLTFLRAWEEAVKCDSFVYDYHLGRAHHSDPSHVKISKILHRDLKANSQIGLNGIISCQELRVAFPNALANYVMGRTAMNTKCTFEKVAQEYYLACYGNTGLQLLTVMEKLASLFDGDYINRMFCPTPRINENIARNMEKVPGVLAEIEKLVCNHEICKYPVQNYLWNELNFFIKYTAVLSEMIKLRASGDEEKTKAMFENEFKPLLTSHEYIDQASIDVMRVIELINNALCTE